MWLGGIVGIIREDKLVVGKVDVVFGISVSELLVFEGVIIILWGLKDWVLLVGFYESFKWEESWILKVIGSFSSRRLFILEWEFLIYRGFYCIGK